MCDRAQTAIRVQANLPDLEKRYCQIGLVFERILLAILGESFEVRWLVRLGGALVSSGVAKSAVEQTLGGSKNLAFTVSLPKSVGIRSMQEQQHGPPMT